LAEQPPLVKTVWESGGERTTSERALLMEQLMVLQPLHADSETTALMLAARSHVPGDVLQRLSPTLAGLMHGYHEAQRVWQIYREKPAKAGAEGVRRLLLVLSKDLRVVFVLLAEQLVAMRHCAHLPEAERKALAGLSADVHAPLANRLGIWQIKWELEDLVFRALQPDTYRRIASELDEKRGGRERYIRDVIRALSVALAQASIKAEVAGRPKHIFSIWKKMSRKNIELSEMFDVRAVRIMVDDVPSCYAALAVVHALWPYISREFDDYIAHPKGNHYRSLHTAVVGPEGKAVEVQIRTFDMHEHAELGVAAHWRYKEGGQADAQFELKIRELRDLLASRDDEAKDDALLKGLSTDILEDRVYVLTPKGQVVDLRKGATVLDFAYAIHTLVGHRCRGAKINGRIVPLTSTPSSGDRIEILTGKEPKPARDWLIQSLGYIATSRARGKIRQWFNENDFAQNAKDGRDMLEREFKRTALVETELGQLLPRFEAKTLDDLYAMVALGDISPGQVLRAVSELHAPATPEVVQIERKRETQRGVKRMDVVQIQGIGNLLWSIAQCCQPLPGDRILGYITKGKGVSVHRSDCKSLKSLISRDQARIIEVQWGKPGLQKFAVRIRITAYDRNGLLRDLTGVLASDDLPIHALHTQVNDGVAEITVATEVVNYEELAHLLGRLSGIPNLIDARRVA